MAKTAKKKIKTEPKAIETPDLFSRVEFIIEKAHDNVLRAVNTNMVIAYWLIGREIVNEIQQGKERAVYGNSVIDKLSELLTLRYKRGYSKTNLFYFRIFFLTYSDRVPEIFHIGCGKSERTEIRHIGCGEFKKGFSPNLGWSHYRALMRVDNENERLFYEIEAEKERWDVKHLERQIHTFLYARLMKSKNKAGVIELASKGNVVQRPTDIFKSSMVLDFLNIPESETLHESIMERAIIANLQQFLLELGSGFAFVARQKRIMTETKEFYIDLVFYNYHLKCFVLIDLKTKELTHQDIGQMDMYVRMYDELQKGEGDNPTVGIILCADKDNTIVKYSVLKGNEQLFASKYRLILPTEDELKREIEREILMVRDHIAKYGKN
jgi:predicted nuclease of restriction endonuclease-like (RecB) superfamily